MNAIKDLMIEFLIQLLKEVRSENKQLKENVREVESQCELYKRMVNDRASERARQFRMSVRDDEDIIDSLIPPESRIECNCCGACAAHLSDDEPDSVS